MPAPQVPTPFAITNLLGETEKLTIKVLTISQLYNWLYLSKDQNEPAMVALCTGKDVAWVDTLEVDSFAKLAAKCSEINFPLAVRLARSAPVAAALVAPLMQKHLLGHQVIAALSLGSGTPPTTQPPSESVPATSKESSTPTASTASVT